MRPDTKFALLTGIAFAVLVGCSTIREAHEAQELNAAKGRGEVARNGKIDLTGSSLEKLVAFALTNRPSIVTARLAVDDARLVMKEIASDAPILSDSPWTAPKVSLSAGHNESSSGTTLRDHDWRTKGDPSASVSLKLLIYDFGRYGAKARAQAEKTVAAELQLVSAGYTVFEETSVAYFSFMEAQALLEVSLTNEMQYAEHLQRAEAKFKAGEANKLDVLRARLDLANAQQNVVAASNKVDTSGATLMNALGIEESRGTWETVLGRSSDGIGMVRRGFAKTEYGVDWAFDLARTNAPAMQVKRANLRAASHSVDYAIADMMPSVSVSASLSWINPLWYFSWGVETAQTIFQGFKKTAAVERATVALKTASCAVDEAEQELSVNLETAIANRDNSVSAMASARVSVKSSKENLDMVKEQFAVGEASRIELSDAIASHSVAIGDAITAFYSGQRAEAMLFGLTGKYPVYEEGVVK